jgi:tellurite resistance protein
VAAGAQVSLVAAGAVQPEVDFPDLDPIEEITAAVLAQLDARAERRRRMAELVARKERRQKMAELAAKVGTG